ncbi:hypothetical protein ACVWZK_007178 [Bradyrhizobium sp. GM0.4]
MTKTIENKVSFNSSVQLPDIGNQVPRAAYSIPEFCKAHRICEAFYYKLRNAGLGPREMRAFRKVTVSIEAATDWRRAREHASQAT